MIPRAAPPSRSYGDLSLMVWRLVPRRFVTSSAMCPLISALAMHVANGGRFYDGWRITSRLGRSGSMLVSRPSHPRNSVAARVRVSPSRWCLLYSASGYFRDSVPPRAAIPMRTMGLDARMYPCIGPCASPITMRWAAMRSEFPLHPTIRSPVRLSRHLLLPRERPALCTAFTFDSPPVTRSSSPRASPHPTGVVEWFGMR
ncbi:hypothetical protein B0H12DRAFT_360534 [Mycena haematopus]|nr:hypothetical protein B0H12DRAFT_360534 [Mycena haematopus]